MDHDSSGRKKDEYLIKKSIELVQCRTSPDNPYIDAIKSVIKAANEVWSLSQIKRFTDHSIKHSERVLDIALDISSALQVKLNKREMFVLIAACYLHDIGMQWGNYCEKSEDNGIAIEDWNEVRRCHADRSVMMIKALLGDRQELEKMNGFRASLSPILRYLDSIQLSSSALMHDLSTIVLAHTKDTNKKETGWNRVFNSHSHGQFRLDLLSALVRYADELDMGRYRVYDFSMFDRKEIPLSALEFWFGCALIDHVSIEVKDSLVVITLQPDYNLIPKSNEMENFACFLIYKQYKKLIHALNKPFIPSLPTISEIFSNYGVGLRVATLKYTRPGMLDETSFNNDQFLKQFENLYAQTQKETVVADAFSLHYFSFPVLPSTQICLVQESNGLRLPMSVKEKVNNWVKNKSKIANKQIDVHTAYHKTHNNNNYIEEFLPDRNKAPLSVLGIAAATMANQFDLDNITILPNKIHCKSSISNDTIKIIFPEFSRSNNWENSTKRAFGPWDIISIKYIPEKETGRESVVFGLLTSLGDTTFVTIPTDQNIETAIFPEYDDDIMKGAGISEFFYDYTGYSDQLDTTEESDQKPVASKEWIRARTELLSEISKKIKTEKNIKRNLVCSIIGFMEDTKSYRVVTWRDDNIIIPDYVNVGVVASALFLILEKGRTGLIEEEPFIKPEIFPNNNKAKLLLGHEGDHPIIVSAQNNQAVLEITTKKESEYKIKQLA